MKQEENRWKKYINQISETETMRGDKAVESLQEYWETWDLYSVHVMMLQQLQKYYPPTPNEDTKIAEYRNKLVSQIVSVPNKRDHNEKVSEWNL